MAESPKSSFNLPYSLESEKAVLGAVMRSPDTLILIENLLIADHFFVDAHKKIYETIGAISAEGGNVDIITVADKLRSIPDPSERLGPNYLIDLVESCPVSQNIEYYSTIVRTDYYRRQIILACQNTIQEASRFTGTVESYIEQVEKQFLKIASEHDRKGLMLGQDVLDLTIQDIERRIAQGDKITGVTTGFKDMDQLFGGWQRSDLVILAARPGMGKTALALNCAFHAAKDQKKVAVFSLEMTKEQLMSRVLAAESKVDSGRLRRGDLTEEEEDKLAMGARRVNEFAKHVGIDETPSLSLMELRSRARRFKKEFGLDLIVIDYLQLMTVSRKVDSREREISEISMGLKSLAKELDVPVIALAQLNRGPDARPDKRPKISDLRESGSMEQDADMIFFIYRDEYYNPQTEDQGLAELLVAKNRHGATATIKLVFQPHFVNFETLYEKNEVALADTGF